MFWASGFLEVHHVGGVYEARQRHSSALRLRLRDTERGAETPDRSRFPGAESEAALGGFGWGGPFRAGRGKRAYYRAEIS